MGLAPYGEDRFADLMTELVKLPEDGWFNLAQPYFGMHEGGESGQLDDDGRIVMGRLYTERLLNALGEPSLRGTVTQREMDIARSTQARFEEAAVHCVSRLHKLVPSQQLVMAGGCALNGVANAKNIARNPIQGPIPSGSFERRRHLPGSGFLGLAQHPGSRGAVPYGTRILGAAI